MNEVHPSVSGLMPAERRAGLVLQVCIVVLAVVGGFLGILGSLISEIQSSLVSDTKTGGVFVLLPIVIAAPMIEEALKPAGVYITLIKWPRALRTAMHIAVLCALGGLVFGLIESWVYVNVYVDDPTDSFVRFRYTVPVTMHVVCSFVYGLGLNRGMIDWANGRGRLGRSTRRSYVAAVLIHGIYNTMAIVLSVVGVLDFD